MPRASRNSTRLSSRWSPWPTGQLAMLVVKPPSQWAPSMATQAAQN